MKNIILFFSAFFLLSLDVFCQSSFTYSVVTPKDERLYDAIEDGNGNYLMVGGKYASDLNLKSAYYLILDDSGNLIAEKEFNNNDSSSFFGIVYYRNDSILF
jgi:hypothetical protein